MSSLQRIIAAAALLCFAVPVEAAGRRNVAIVLYPGVELLDFAGPGEVFAAASAAFRVYTVAESKQPLVSEGFVTIVPEFSIADAPAPDILVIPGGRVRSVTGSPAMLAWVKQVTAKNEVTMSVCNGALVLAENGTLAGLKATTHWSALGALREREPRATVVDDVRFVDNGRVITTAGVSAGIDGALHLVARLLGADEAAEVAHYMQYESVGWREARRAK
jgi:transcriptional regulator GlxA family with amidase domain